MADDVNDQTDPQGVPVEQAIPQGALSKVTGPNAGSSAATGSLADQRDYAAQQRGNMDNLEQQYANANDMESRGYASQLQSLEDAKNRLLSMNFGPSEQEQRYRAVAAMAQPGTVGGFNSAAYAAGQAGNLQATREADLQKQQLIAQYGMEGPGLMIKQANAEQQKDAALLRIQAGLTKQANTAVDHSSTVAPKALGGGWFAGPGGTAEFHPEIAQAINVQKQQQAQQAAAIKIATQKAIQGQLDPSAINLFAGVFREQGAAGLPRNLPRYAVSAIANQAAQDAAANNDTAGSLIANQQLTKNQAAVLGDFTKGSGVAKTLTGINTAVQHYSTLLPLVDKLQNGDNTLFNLGSQWWKTNMGGDTAPTDYKGVAAFLAGEIAKSALPDGGGEGERIKLAQSAASANSPQAIKSILSKWNTLLAGKTIALKNQWDIGTRGAYGDFNSKFLLPATRNALGVESSAVTPPQHPGQTTAPAAHPVLQDPIYLKYAQPQQ